MDTTVMRTLVSIAIAFCALFFQHAGAAETQPDDWGAPTNNVQMSIRLSAGGTEIKTNEPVRLLIRYKNVSTNDTIDVMDFWAPPVNVTYSFQVISPSGKDVSPIPLKAHGGSASDHLIDPGKTFECEFNASEVCKFDEIGTYHLTVKKALYSIYVKEWFIVVSNDLTFDVRQ